MLGLAWDGGTQYIHTHLGPEREKFKLWVQFFSSPLNFFFRVEFINYTQIS